MTILVGSSGWSYDDWLGRFYPHSLASKKGDWFAYYARFFKTVEINSTFYRPPGELQVKSWIKKAKVLQSFQYSLKMPELVTHKSMVEGDTKKASFWATSFERTSVKPLHEAGCLGCVLLQLSPYFRNDGSALATLGEVLDSISTKEYDYAVEFRHRSWLDMDQKEIHRDALDLLREDNVACVLLDGPGAPPTKELTADHAYFRFHGRNADIWFAGDREREDDYRIDRYDYLYNEDQLEAWVPRIQDAELRAKKVMVYFNNHARAKAIKNAFQLMDLLAIDHPEAEVHLQDQFTLGQF